MQIIEKALNYGIRLGFKQGVEWGRKYPDGDPPFLTSVTSPCEYPPDETEQAADATPHRRDADHSPDPPG